MGEAKQRLDQKKAEFAAHPEEFVRMSDVVIGIVQARDDDGNAGIMPVASCDAPRASLVQALFDLDNFIRAYVNKKDLDSYRAKKGSEIIVPGKDNGKNRLGGL